MAHVAIIGGGLLGAATAARMARRHRVTLFEQGEQLGSEATSQNAGMQRRLAHDPVERRLALQSGRLLEQEAYRPYVRRVGGMLVLGEADPRYDEAVIELRDSGVEVREGALPAVMQGCSAAQVWSVPDEGLLDAHGLATACWREAAALGAVLRRGVVAGVSTADGRVEGVHGEHGRVQADVVVLATGAWSSRVAGSLGLDRPLVPLARHLVLTTPTPLASADHPWVWLDPLGFYLRPEAGGWLSSPCDETVVHPGNHPGSAGPVDSYVAAVWHDKAARFPALDGLEIRRGWTGLRTFAPDRRPVVGPDPEVEGLFWVTGAGGFGVSAGLALGQLAADLLDGRPTQVDAEWVRPGRSFPDPLVLSTLQPD